MKAQRLTSYKHLEKQMAEEPWTDVEYFGIHVGLNDRSSYTVEYLTSFKP